MRILLICFGLFLMPCCLALNAGIFPPDTNYILCFTPQDDCTKLIVDRLDKAQHSIHMQGYSFTSKPIANALVNAAHRDVLVRAIFDKSQFMGSQFSLVRYVQHNGVQTWMDYQLNIAHNKVLIVDGEWIMTGSFNFTAAAQKKNAENVLWIHSKQLAQAYENNWAQRLSQSIDISHPQKGAYLHVP